MELANLICRYVFAAMALGVAWHVAHTWLKSRGETLSLLRARMDGLDRTQSEFRRIAEEQRQQFFSRLKEQADRISSAYEKIDADGTARETRIARCEEKFKTYDKDQTAIAETVKAHGELLGTHDRRIEKHSDAIGRFENERFEIAKAFEEVRGRCDKNTAALENTAKNLKEALDARFAGAALRGAFNPGQRT
jgi:chromosome segregation ATPase